MNGIFEFQGLRAIADAILYEGYLPHPYRRPSPMSDVRWAFGVLAPGGGLSAGAHPATSANGPLDARYQQTECLVAARDNAVIHVRLRFLQVHHHGVQRTRSGGGFEPVDALHVGDQQYLTFDETVPVEHEVHAAIADLGKSPLVVAVCAAVREDIEPLPDDAGCIVRACGPIFATMRLSVHDVAAPLGLTKVRVIVRNSAVLTGPGIPQRAALSASMLATHTLIGVEGGAFVSLLDPPEQATSAAKACRNIHTFPVLGGEQGRDDLMLSSPILLSDHPAVSPEIRGDVFDDAEIGLDDNAGTDPYQWCYSFSPDELSPDAPQTPDPDVCNEDQST